MQVQDLEHWQCARTASSGPAPQKARAKVRCKSQKLRLATWLWKSRRQAVYQGRGRPSVTTEPASSTYVLHQIWRCGITQRRGVHTLAAGMLVSWFPAGVSTVLPHGRLVPSDLAGGHGRSQPRERQSEIETRTIQWRQSHTLGSLGHRSAHRPPGPKSVSSFPLVPGQGFHRAGHVRVTMLQSGHEKGR